MGVRFVRVIQGIYHNPVPVKWGRDYDRYRLMLAHQFLNQLY